MQVSLMHEKASKDMDHRLTLRQYFNDKAKLSLPPINYFRLRNGQARRRNHRSSSNL